MHPTRAGAMWNACSLLLYMCPHTNYYVWHTRTCNMWNACRRVYMCRHTSVCVLISLYVSSYLCIYMCPHTSVECMQACICVAIPLYVSSYLYVCPHTSVYICVLIPLWNACRRSTAVYVLYLCRTATKAQILMLRAGAMWNACRRASARWPPFTRVNLLAS